MYKVVRASDQESLIERRRKKTSSKKRNKAHLHEVFHGEKKGSGGHQEKGACRRSTEKDQTEVKRSNGIGD